jgi:hypothetical protein
MTTIKMPMDQDLYDAAVKVMDTIEEKLAKADRRLSDEEVLGRPTAEAYRSWHSLLIAKYVTKPEPSESTLSAGDDPEPKLDGRRNSRPPKPTKNHPWRGPAKRQR